VAFDHSIVGKTFGPVGFDYDWQKPALYALACGATEEELDLLLENRGPKVLPTFSVAVALKPLHESLMALGGNMLTLVHGGQRCTMHRPIPSDGHLETTCTVRALYDKGKGALAVYETKTVDAKGEPLFDTEWQIFYRGEGGFGGERGPDAPPYEPPAGKPADVHLEMKTSPTLALLYRLASQDLNPIHANPEVAKMAGFPKPILHGLCTFGHAGRAAVNGLCGGDATKLTGIEGRFSKPVFPGETIVTDLWRTGAGEAYYVTSVKERGEAVITLGRVTISA
jgi:acyl dehydratase